MNSMTGKMFAFTALLMATFACTSAASCVQNQDFCLVRPALNVSDTCNQFRDQVALPACQATDSQQLSFGAIGEILNASVFATEFFETCNCECPSVSPTTYVRDNEACFDRAFLAGTGNCPGTQSLTCDQIQTVMCPELPYRYTGGTLITC